ncbi:MAG: rod shape-determining protein MreC [Verrucomicrobiota bacterium]|jgi:rod shape-determining protein MreC
MLKQPHIVTLCSVLTAGIVLLSLPLRVNTQIKWVAAGLFLPFIGLAAAADQKLESIQSIVVSKQELLRENQRLRKELENYKIALLQRKTVVSENDLLREEILWKKRQPWNLLPARVQVKEPSNWWSSLYINVGTEDGVVENTPVLSPQGLVGKVDQVERHRSKVRLVGDPHCRVSAMLAQTATRPEAEQAHGTVMTGQDTQLNPRMVSFQHLPLNTRIEPGAEVITSGMGGGFPRGIPLGHVVDSRSSGVGLFAEARVRLTVDLNRLEMVWLILPAERNGRAPGEDPR